MSKIVSFSYSVDYSGIVNQLKNHLDKKFSKKLLFIEQPLKVPKGCHKPYSISVEDETVFDLHHPLNDERKPILLESHEHFGDPEEGALDRLESYIESVINDNTSIYETLGKTS